MNNTITKTDDQVNNSNEVITQEQMVDNVLNSEIQKIKDLKVKLKENDQWSVKNFDGIECNFFDYINDGKFSRNQIETWLDLNLDIDELVDDKWEEEWTDVVRERMYDYSSYQFDFVKDDWLEDEEIREDSLNEELRRILG